MALNWSDYSVGTQAAPTRVKAADDAPMMGPELWAALVGAAVAGLIGILTQYIVIWDNKKRRDEERRETQIALARSVVIKTMRIQGNLHGQLKHIIEGTAIGKARGATMRHHAVRPLGNLPEPVEFRPEELALVASLGGGFRLDEYMSLDSRHNSLLQLWSLYRTGRQQLETSLNPTSFEGAVGSIVLSHQDFLKFQGQMVALDDLIQQLEVLLWDYLKETTGMLEEVIAAINSKLGTKLEMQYKGSHKADMQRFREVIEGQDTGAPQG